MTLRIRPFEPSDEAPALALEARCIQGRGLSLRFERPSFAARSAQYLRFSILVAEWESGHLAGITAWAAKPAHLRGSPLATAVHYDLRVDPESRGRGVAQALMGAALEDAEPHAECHYAFAAGQNVAVMKAIQRFGRPYHVRPLEFLCLPISSTGQPSTSCSGQPRRVRDTCDRVHPSDLTFDELPENAAAYVSSVEAIPGAAAASLWDPSGYLAERIMRIPPGARLLGALFRPFPFLPDLPRPGERLRTWHAYDMTAQGDQEARVLVREIRAAARRGRQTMLTTLLAAGDPRLDRLKRAAGIRFIVPYRLLLTGRKIPEPADRMRIDPRDL